MVKEKELKTPLMPYKLSVILTGSEYKELLFISCKEDKSINQLVRQAVINRINAKA
jgi:hypothetical protein